MTTVKTHFTINVFFFFSVFFWILQPKTFWKNLKLSWKMTSTTPHFPQHIVINARTNPREHNSGDWILSQKKTMSFTSTPDVDVQHFVRDCLLLQKLWDSDQHLTQPKSPWLCWQGHNSLYYIHEKKDFCSMFIKYCNFLCRIMLILGGVPETQFLTVHSNAGVRWYGCEVMKSLFDF